MKKIKTIFLVLIGLSIFGYVGENFLFEEELNEYSYEPTSLDDLYEQLEPKSEKKDIEITEYPIEIYENLNVIESLYCFIDDSMTKSELLTVSEKCGLWTYSDVDISEETGKETGREFVFISEYSSTGNGYTDNERYRFTSDNIFCVFSNGKLASATYQFYGGGEHFPYPYRIVHSPRGLRIHSLVETEPLYKYMVCDITSNIIGTDSAIDAFSEYRGLDK